MYIRLAFWTLSLAYTAVLFSNSTRGSSPGIMVTAALLGAVFGFGLGGMLINRRSRKRGFEGNLLRR
jgi:predicted MFS family arabinose efflux permease